MRLIRFVDESGEIQFGEDLADGSAQLLTGSLAGGFDRTTGRLQVRKLLAPLIPTDIICIGRNYLSEAASDERSRHSRRSEKGGGGAQHCGDADLEVFLKPSTALQNPNDPILIPHFDGIDMQLDCEGELAIVIGRPAHNVSESAALQYVFGYTLANDVTARCFRTPAGPPIWMRGKGFDTFCPLGPAIVTVDEIADPNNLDIQTTINGQVTSSGNTSRMIRNVPQIIAALSRHMTLREGSVVLTGAPQAIRTSTGLRANDHVAVQVSRCGLKLENLVAMPCPR